MDKLERIRNFFNILLFKSIMSRLVILYLALVFIVMIVSGIFIYIGIRNMEANRVHNELQRTALFIEDQILRDLPPSPDLDALGYTLINNVPIGNVLPVILDHEGNVLAPIREATYQDSVIITAMTGQEDFQAWVRRAVGFQTPEDGMARMWFNFAMPTFNAAGDIEYIIFLSMDASAHLDNLTAVTRTIVIAGIITMVLAAVLGFLFSTTLTEPISSLTKGMAKGNLDQKIEVKSDDEIGQLTHSFNSLAESLSKTIFDMGNEKNRIEIILQNMTDGVLAYDSDDNLIYANSASSEMLDIIDIESVSFSAIMEKLDLHISSSTDLVYIPPDDSIVKVDDKYISVSYNIYRNIQGDAEGVVLVLQDVTKHTKLDNMRREFVANVSHEIRTPLTTIKSYTETLLESNVDGSTLDDPTVRNFLETINAEADRMTFLTTDLLELSRFDNKQLSIQLEDAELISLIRNSIRQNSVLAEEKSQTIEFDPPSGSFPITCDSSRINQVFNNVLSNAIKYSAKDTTITVTLTESQETYDAAIKDTGIGIPAEDLDRIFERFYRVDKARSRAMGGTGLGLAIAKEIMDIHEGTIYALSEAGVGTTMVMQFKKLH